MNAAENALFREPAIAALLRDFAKNDMEREETRAKANPLAHKLTRVFGAGVSTNYRYYTAPTNGKGQRVVFAYSVHRNVAGFFLGWRETYRKNGTVKRDMWLARRVRSRCKDIAKARAAKVAA